MWLRLLAVLSLVLSAAAEAEASSPYPPSELFSGITWDTASHRSAGLGGDLWSTTSDGSGRVYTSWGDGIVVCPTKVSYGVAYIAAGAPGVDLHQAGCGPVGVGQGKLISLLATGRWLNAIVYLQDKRRGVGSVAVWRSADRGRTWRKPSWSFTGGDVRPEEFVHFGPGNLGAPDGLVYLTVERPDDPLSLYLARVRADRLQTRSAYEFLAGTGTPATWTADAARAVAIFADRAGLDGPVMTWNARLGRYLLTAGHGAGDRFGLFEAPAMWGPWRTIDYRSGWLGIRQGAEYLGVSFPTAWIGPDGSSVWAVLSCWNPPVKGRPADAGPCGAYNDRYNLMRAQLVRARAGS